MSHIPCSSISKICGKEIRKYCEHILLDPLLQVPLLVGQHRSAILENENSIHILFKSSMSFIELLIVTIRILTQGYVVTNF